ncbi:hypothetical protein AAFN69_07360 [Streptomyces sp. CAU 1734]
MDPDPAGKPSVLRTALAAWSSIEDGATHQLVVQDDMILSASFFERARAAVEAMPHAALALFALWDSRGGAAVRFGAMTGARWVGAVNEYFPCVAIILPRDVAAGFVEYGRARLDAWPDDILMYQYLRSRKVPAYISVPSLAEHEDHGSISGNAFRGPRRSVCFLPDDEPVNEAARLEGLRVLPFFKHGVAQCTVRVDGPGPERWLHLTCEEYLEGSGIRRERLDSAISRLTGADDPEAARGTWLTAFAMGFAHRRQGFGAELASTPVLAESLATIGPGGVSYTRSEERIAELRDNLARIAGAALEAGLDAGGRPGSRVRVPGPVITLLGGASPLGEHIARGLTDRGHTIARARGADPLRPGGAVIDLRPLRDGTAAAVTVRLHDGAPGGMSVHTLHTGDLYGPGCPRDSVIGRLVWSALRSRPMAVTDPPGPPLRPLHVTDLITALSAVVRNPPAERSLTLADPAPLSVREVAEAIRAAVRPVPVETVPTAGSTGPAGAENAGNAGKAVNAGNAEDTERGETGSRPAGWKPEMDLHHGLHTFMQWLAYEGIQYVPE